MSGYSARSAASVAERIIGASCAVDKAGVKSQEERDNDKESDERGRQGNEGGRG